MLSRNQHIVLAVFAGVVLSGCATESFSVPVMRPAPVDLSRYKVIAVAHFSGQCCEQMGGFLAEALRHAPNPMTGDLDFTVVDRRELDRMLDDLQHRRGGELDAESAALLDRWRNADVLIEGEVPIAAVEEQIAEHHFLDAKGLPRIRYTREGTARVSVVITTTDGQGRQLIDRVRFDEVARASATAVDARPPPIDYTGLISEAQQSIAYQYLRRIQPHEEYVKVQLYTDGDLPELKIGNGLARVGSWDDALESYRDALARAENDLAEVRYKALFNLGVALEYTNRFSEARQAFKEAYTLEQDSRILRELERLTYREREYVRLMEQGRPTGSPVP